MSEEKERFEVGAEDAGARLDVFLVKHLPGLGRAGAKRFIAEGRVRVNGRVRRKGATLAPGEVVSLEGEPEVADFEPLPDPDVPVRVAHEDEDFLVLDKPAGVPSHPLRPHELGTVANFLAARFPEAMPYGRARRDGGLLHRLDNETSGLMLAARSLRGSEALESAMRAGEVSKRYRALCAGAVRAPQLVDMPVGHDTQDRKKMRAVVGYDERGVRHPREAETEILRSEVCGDRSLVELSVRSARRHQVRVHMATLGHPLVGDALYEGPPLEGLSRHFLHASALRFRRPSSGEELSLTSPLPEELASALAREGFRP